MILELEVTVSQNQQLLREELTLKVVVMAVVQSPELLHEESTAMLVVILSYELLWSFDTAERVPHRLA